LTLLLAAMALIRGGESLRAGSITYGFLYNGKTYTTLAAPDASSTYAKAVSGDNVVG
jgi:hypothetical protein